MGASLHFLQESGSSKPQDYESGLLQMKLLLLNGADPDGKFATVSCLSVYKRIHYASHYASVTKVVIRLLLIIFDVIVMMIMMTIIIIVIMVLILILVLILLLLLILIITLSSTCARCVWHVSYLARPACLSCFCDLSDLSKFEPSAELLLLMSHLNTTIVQGLHSCWADSTCCIQYADHQKANSV